MKKHAPNKRRKPNKLRKPTAPKMHCKPKRRPRARPVTLADLEAMEHRIMAKYAEDHAELMAALTEANETTNEIAADLDELLTTLGDNPTAGQIAELKSTVGNLRDRLKGVASKYPTEPTT